MTISGWVVAIFIVVLIVLLCFAIGWSLRKHQVQPGGATGISEPRPEVWSETEPSTDSARNVCLLYTFPNRFVNGASGPVYVPGAPTFDTDTLNHMQRNPYPPCLLPNQIIAQQLEHVCTAPLGATDPNLARCYDLKGNLVGLGSVETLYSNVNCAPISPCLGEPSLIQVNAFSPYLALTGSPGSYTGATGVPSLCLQVSNLGTTGVFAAPCDPTNDYQVFLVSRTSIDTQPSSATQRGAIAQLYNPVTQTCLAQSLIFDEFVDYDQLSVGCTGTGSSASIFTHSVIAGNCINGIAPGYTWLVAPSFAYCDEPSGCNGCTALNSCTSGCNPVPGTTVCAGGCGSNCTGNTPMPTVPQLIYVGNRLNQIPFDRNGYEGLTGAPALFKWLVDGQFRAMFADNRGRVGMNYIGVDVNVCETRQNAVKFIPLQQYNRAKDYPVCVATSSVPCLPL